jgi:hypothetical protein
VNVLPRIASCKANPLGVAPGRLGAGRLVPAARPGVSGSSTAMGNPTRIGSAASPKNPACQPKCVISAAAVNGAVAPPTAMPLIAKPSDRPRWASNRADSTFTYATELDALPNTPTNIAATYRPARPTCAIAAGVVARPMLNSTREAMMGRRVPKRSIMRPASGIAAAIARAMIVSASAISARFQPSACVSGLMKTLKLMMPTGMTETATPSTLPTISAH